MAKHIFFSKSLFFFKSCYIYSGLFCRLLFHISALWFFQLAEGERGRASKYICDTVSPPNITIIPLKAIRR